MLFAPLFWSLSFHFGLFSIGCVINSDSYRTSIYSKCRIGDCCFYFYVGSSFLASTLTLILAMPPRAHGREFRGVRVSNGVSLNPPCAVVETLVVDDETTLRNAATSSRRHGASSSDSLLAKSNGSGDNAHRLSITLGKWYMYAKGMVAAITRNRLSITLR